MFILSFLIDMRKFHDKMYNKKKYINSRYFVLFRNLLYLSLSSIFAPTSNYWHAFFAHIARVLFARGADCPRIYGHGPRSRRGCRYSRDFANKVLWPGNNVEPNPNRGVAEQTERAHHPRSRISVLSLMPRETRRAVRIKE